MCFGSCSKLKISTFLGICSYGMHIFLLQFCAIHAISSTSFWVGPLWFSALHMYIHVYCVGKVSPPPIPTTTKIIILGPQKPPQATLRLICSFWVNVLLGCAHICVSYVPPQLKIPVRTPTCDCSVTCVLCSTTVLQASCSCEGHAAGDRDPVGPDSSLHGRQGGSVPQPPG